MPINWIETESAFGQMAQTEPEGSCKGEKEAATASTFPILLKRRKVKLSLGLAGGESISFLQLGE